MNANSRPFAEVRDRLLCGAALTYAETILQTAERLDPTARTQEAETSGQSALLFLCTPGLTHPAN